MKMEIEQNTISRDWTVVHEGRRFYVNLTESDGQTLALCNRDNWDILEETETGTEELNCYIFSDSTPEQKREAEENAWRVDKLIAFCIRNWNNAFMQELKETMEAERKRIEG
jgi:hypothetical protein